MTDTFKSIMSDEARSTLIRTMMANGVSRADANANVDLAIHAEQQVMDLISRVVRSGPRGTQEQLLSMALGIVGARVKLETEALVAMAVALGIRVMGPEGDIIHDSRERSQH